VTPQRQARVVGLHARAVVDDAHALAAAAVDVDLDARRARVQRVFDQLLDHRSGAFDHLAAAI
jgi:hypothetical protein